MSGELPFTGLSLTILGVAFGLSWIVAIALTVVLVGVVLLRVATRSQRRGTA